MNKSEKEMSMGEYLSYLSAGKDIDPYEETYRPRVEAWPREWSECFLCYRDGEDPSRCHSNLESSPFCRDKVRIQ